MLSKAYPHGDLLSLARPCLFKVPQPLPTAPSSGNQVFASRSLWGRTLHIQMTRMINFSVLALAKRITLPSPEDIYRQISFGWGRVTKAKCYLEILNSCDFLLNAMFSFGVLYHITSTEQRMSPTCL